MRKSFPVLLTALLMFPSGAALARGHQELGWVERPSLTTSYPLLARERGGGGRSGSRSGGNRRAHTGLGRQSSNFKRGDRRPSGGWSRRVGEGDRARRSFDRANQDRSRRERMNRGDWNRAQSNLRDRSSRIDRDRVRRNFNAVDRNDWNRARERTQDRWDNARERTQDRWDRTERRVDRAIDRIDDWDNHWPGWARPGWGVARPWRVGWYGGWRNPPWGWWPGRSVAWGLGSLATAAVINNAVNDAINASRTTILVPQSSYTLYYNSVEPSNDQQVNFVASDRANRLTMQADCNSGLLNGQDPADASQAQLLNAACQVAFGSA